MDDLVTWLREQIAEDEAVARRADPGPWVIRQLGRRDGAVVLTDVGLRTPATKLPTGGKCVADTSGRVEAVVNANHIARHDPRSVLAQCEAHRAILNQWESLHDAPTGTPCVGFVHRELSNVVLALALAYRHRPGYQETWRP